jgi:heat shock protein HslJ
MPTHRRQLRWRALPLALLLGLAACGDDTMTGPSAVQGGVWKLQTLQRGSAAAVTVSQPDRYTIEFREGGLLDVKADCNRCSGPYTLSGSSLQVGNLACTIAVCPADSLDQDFVAVLSGALTHGVKDDVLTITSTAGQMTLKQ